MFTSMDVYDAASSIGRECQLIVGQYGTEALQRLMPKVIAMLEELEGCAAYCEREKKEIVRVQQLLEGLRREGKAQSELKEKIDRVRERERQQQICVLSSHVIAFHRRG